MLMYNHRHKLTTVLCQTCRDSTLKPVRRSNTHKKKKKKKKEGEEEEEEKEEEGKGEEECEDEGR